MFIVYCLSIGFQKLGSIYIGCIALDNESFRIQTSERVQVCRRDDCPTSGAEHSYTHTRNSRHIGHPTNTTSSELFSMQQFYRRQFKGVEHQPTVPMQQIHFTVGQQLLYFACICTLSRPKKLEERNMAWIFNILTFNHILFIV